MESNLTGQSINKADLVDKSILYMEEKYDLLRHEVEGWSIWPLFRHWISREAIGHDAKMERPQSRLLKTLLIALNSMPKLLFIKPAGYLIKTYTSARAEISGGYYVDIYFDRLQEHIDECYKIETVNVSDLFYRSHKSLKRSNLYSPILEAYLYVKRISDTHHSKHGKLAEYFRSIFADELNVEVPARDIINKILNFIWSLKFYEFLIDQVDPHHVLTADPGEYALYAVARKRQIKTIEFCHGYYDRIHPAYSWNEYALPYVDNMPIPDKILVYGDFLRDEIRARNFWGGRVKTVGSIRMDEYRQNKKGKYSDGCCVITFTTSGNENSETIDFIRKFLEIVRKHGFILKLNIKMHPVYDRDSSFYIQSFKDFNEFVTIYPPNSMISTYELISQSNLHLSISSSCHYDALGLGIPTLILPLGNWHHVSNLYEHHHALMPTSPKQLYDLVVDYRKYRVADEVSNYYFKPNALSSILEEIR